MEPVRISTSEKTDNGKDDGLKMCAERPSRVHRMKSLAKYPSAMIRNCQWNHSGLKTRKKLMLSVIGTGPKPSS